jgi:hypothetical protein
MTAGIPASKTRLEPRFQYFSPDERPWRYTIGGGPKELSGRIDLHRIENHRCRLAVRILWNKRAMCRARK